MVAHRLHIGSDATTRTMLARPLRVGDHWPTLLADVHCHVVRVEPGDPVEAWVELAGAAAGSTSPAQRATSRPPRRPAHKPERGALIRFPDGSSLPTSELPEVGDVFKVPGPPRVSYRAVRVTDADRIAWVELVE